MLIRRFAFDRRPAHVVLAVAFLVMGTRSPVVAIEEGCSCSQKSSQVPNGISVGTPKVFDDRSLVLQLESLSESLRNLQVIDQARLAAALGMQQGFASTEFLSNFTVTGLPGATNDVDIIKNTGNVNAQGGALPDTVKTTTSQHQAAFTPSVPVLDATTNAAPSAFAPAFGQSASDVLSDQVSLTYQIFNLRMLLERSLSDRLLATDPRLQAVLGFNVAIDPPRTAADAVAVVEVTLEDSAAGNGLSLVSLMPQEKTYNTAALSTRSNAFGGAAVVKMFQVAFSQRRRAQTFYLYRDADTISYERMTSDGKSVVFGWMFRPVLGRRSVSPGMRQLFAVVALPGDFTQARTLNAGVRTYWKRFDRDTMTSFLPADATRPARLGYALSLGLGRPKIFGDRYTNTAIYRGIEVKGTPTYEKGLRAQVSGVRWRPIGATSALVTVSGRNFFTGSKVAVGDKIYGVTPESLTVKSSTTLEFTTSLEALGTSQASLIGRYGGSVPILSEPSQGAATGGVAITQAVLSSTLGGSRLLDITLVGDGGKALTTTDLPMELDEDKNPVGPQSPLVLFNGTLVKPPYTFFNDASGLVLRATVPDSAIESSGGGMVRVSWPFLPEPEWSPTQRIGDSCQLIRALRLGGKSVYLRRLSESGFTRKPDLSVPTTSDYCWQIVVGDKATPILSSVCKGGEKGPTIPGGNNLSVTLSADLPDRFLLLDPGGQSCVVAMSEVEPKVSEKPKNPEIKQYDSVWLPIAVKDSSAVQAAEADGHPLPRRVPTDAKGKPIAELVEVEVTRAVTAQPGMVDITLLDAGGNRLKIIRLTVVPCLECRK
jgi:hypothetical protein